MGLREFLEKTYGEIADNIKFIEAKNTALITLNSALLVLLGDAIFDDGASGVYRIMLSLLMVVLCAAIGCAIFSFCAASGSKQRLVGRLYAWMDRKNSLASGRKKLMYYAYIHKFFPDDPEGYWRSVTRDLPQGEEAPDPLLMQLAGQIVDLSGVAYRKAVLFNTALQIELGCFAVWGVACLAVLLGKAAELF